MNWWMSFWQYVIEPTDGSLGQLEWLVIGGIALVAALSILLPRVLEEIRSIGSMLAARGTRHSATESREVGMQETRLRVELWVKVRIGIVVWCGALILSLLLRLVGTPGLKTHWLPTLVLAVLPFLVGYTLMYRLVFYPRYVDVCRRIDTHKSYEPTAKKRSSKKANV